MNTMFACTPVERENARARVVSDLGHPVINRLTSEQIEFLIAHEVMHARLRKYIASLKLSENADAQL